MQCFRFFSRVVGPSDPWSKKWGGHFLKWWAQTYKTKHNWNLGSILDTYMYMFIVYFFAKRNLFFSFSKCSQHFQYSSVAYLAHRCIPSSNGHMLLQKWKQASWFFLINFFFFFFFFGGGGGRVRFFPFYSIQSDSSPFCSILFYPIFLQSKMSINQISNNKNCSNLQQMNETLVDYLWIS